MRALSAARRVPPSGTRLVDHLPTPKMEGARFLAEFAGALLRTGLVAAVSVSDRLPRRPNKIAHLKNPLAHQQRRALERNTIRRTGCFS